MDKVLQSSLSSGVMEMRQDGTNNRTHYCVACAKTVSEPVPHLQGKDHQKNLAWHTLQQATPSMELLNNLPGVVRAAKLNGELELVDKAHFSYRCLVCPKKSPFSGIKQLEDHLIGKEHEKARKIMPVASQPPPPPQPHQPPYVCQPLYTQPPNSGLYSSNNQPQYTPATSIQSSNFSSDRYPPVQYPQHITGPPGYPQPSQTRPSQPLYSPNPQLPGSTRPSLLTSAHPYVSPDTSSMTASTMPSDLLSRDILPADIEGALKTRVVERGAGTSFKCLKCDKTFTGIAPLREHLNSDRHKKKVQSALSPLVHDTSRLTIGDRRPMPSVMFESAPIGVAPIDEIDGSLRFPWPIVSTTPPHISSEDVYRNLSNPRGLVLIFNYYFTGQGIMERHGAKRDSVNLQTLFTHMGYQVYLYEDLSKRGTLDRLRELQDSQFCHHYDSLIVFVMSHGHDTTHFCCRDKELMSLDDVRYCFTDNNCQALRGKPKLFYVNFCRGNLREPQTQYDSMGIQQMAPKDMATVYSCIDQFQAPRHPQHGTPFVRALCETLATHAHHMEMQDLHREMCKTVDRNNGATPEIQCFHFKKFFFNPIQQ